MSSISVSVPFDADVASINVGGGGGPALLPTDVDAKRSEWAPQSPPSLRSSSSR